MFTCSKRSIDVVVDEVYLKIFSKISVFMKNVFKYFSLKQYVVRENVLIPKNISAKSYYSIVGTLINLKLW